MPRRLVLTAFLMSSAVVDIYSSVFRFAKNDFDSIHAKKNQLKSIHLTQFDS